MPEKPKHHVAEKKDTWSEDQKDRGYYYDDAHGYEEYEPDGEDDNADGDRDESEPPATAGGSDSMRTFPPSAPLPLRPRPPDCVAGHS